MLIRELEEPAHEPTQPKMRHAVGCAVLARETGRLLLLKRSSKLTQGGTWSTCGGEVDHGESKETALKRELAEEIHYKGPFLGIEPWGTVVMSGWSYDAFVVIVEKEFNPVLNWENTDYSWLRLGDLSKLSPQHPGLSKLMSEHGQAIERVVSENSPKLPPKPGRMKKFIDRFKKKDKPHEKPIRRIVSEMASKIAPEGLGMSTKDKEERAFQQGYSKTIWYHGSKSKTVFTEWKVDDAPKTSHGGGNNNLYGPGIYLAKSEKVSKGYSTTIKQKTKDKSPDYVDDDGNPVSISDIKDMFGKAAWDKMIQNPRKLRAILSDMGIYPSDDMEFSGFPHVRLFRLRLFKPFKCTRTYEPSPAERVLIEKYGYAMPDGNHTGQEVYFWWYNKMKDKSKINDLLKKMGYDSIYHKGSRDFDVMIVLDPGRIRDIDAVYDPTRIGENNSIC